MGVRNGGNPSVGGQFGVMFLTLLSPYGECHGRQHGRNHVRVSFERVVHRGMRAGWAAKSNEQVVIN